MVEENVTVPEQERGEKCRKGPIDTRNKRRRISSGAKELPAEVSIFSTTGKISRLTHAADRQKGAGARGISGGVAVSEPSQTPGNHRGWRADFR